MFKKGILLLALTGSVVSAAADDAFVLPEGVIRTRIIPSVSSFSEQFDADGDREAPLLGETSLTILSLALEYGVTDWMTAGVQWAPGMILGSEFENRETAQLTGPHDLFAGAKIQLLGDNGLKTSDNLRVAVTPGVIIPLSSYDAEKEFQNFATGEDFQSDRVDRGAVGLGSRFSVDYQLTPSVYLNVYNQTLFFLETKQDPDLFTTDADVKYGTEMVFEGEAHYGTSFGQGINLGIGLPLTYTMTGETEINGTGQDDASNSLELKPYVGVFFTEWVVPTEFELGYSTTLAGENSFAINTLSLQIKNYLKF